MATWASISLRRLWSCSIHVDFQSNAVSGVAGQANTRVAVLPRHTESDARLFSFGPFSLVSSPQTFEQAHLQNWRGLMLMAFRHLLQGMSYCSWGLPVGHIPSTLGLYFTCSTKLLQGSNINILSRWAKNMSTWAGL